MNRNIAFSEHIGIPHIQTKAKHNNNNNQRVNDNSKMTTVSTEDCCGRSISITLRETMFL